MGTCFYVSPGTEFPWSSTVRLPRERHVTWTLCLHSIILPVSPSFMRMFPRLDFTQSITSLMYQTCTCQFYRKDVFASFYWRIILTATFYSSQALWRPCHAHPKLTSLTHLSYPYIGQPAVDEEVLILSFGSEFPASLRPPRCLVAIGFDASCRISRISDKLGLDPPQLPFIIYPWNQLIDSKDWYEFLPAAACYRIFLNIKDNYITSISSLSLNFQTPPPPPLKPLVRLGNLVLSRYQLVVSLRSLLVVISFGELRPYQSVYTESFDHPNFDPTSLFRIHDPLRWTRCEHWKDVKVNRWHRSRCWH